MDLNPVPAPSFTAVDALTQGLSALVYLVVGAAAVAHAPRDSRTRVFLAFSLSNLVVLAVPTVMWTGGVTDLTKLPRSATAAISAGLGVAALILFHFTQVFPRRRPWIRTSGIQMPAAYGLVPIVILGLVWFLPQNVADISAAYVMAFFVFGFPLIVLIAIVLPLGAIVSLLRSHREVQRDGLERLKRPIEWILIGQVAGGTLAVVFAPVLAVVAPSSLLQAAVTAAIWALGMLTPLAFAAAVWRYDLLAVSEDADQP